LTRAARPRGVASVSRSAAAGATCQRRIGSRQPCGPRCTRLRRVAPVDALRLCDAIYGISFVPHGIRIGLLARQARDQ
jgi:hypothetical protein